MFNGSPLTWIANKCPRLHGSPTNVEPGRTTCWTLRLQGLHQQTVSQERAVLIPGKD